MNKSGFFLGIVLASVLGGLIAIYASKYIFDDPVQEPVATSENFSGFRLSTLAQDTNIVVPEGLNFIVAAKIVTPGVVHIKSMSSNSGGYVHPFEKMFPDFFENHPNDLPATATGSGVIISEDGYIITNYHVVENAEKIEVTLDDNRRYSATLVGDDPTTDLALVKIEETRLPMIRFGDSDKVNIGEWVLAVGNPFELTSTITAGIVSAKARNINILRGRELGIESFIQTDAVVNPGNSGGALVNLRGELIGINTAIATPTGTFTGYSFAIPSSLARKVMNDLMEYGTVQRALLGIRIQDMNADLANDLGLKEFNGVYIAAVNEGSSAREAGLKVGDVIVAIDGNAVKNVSELQELVARNRPGDKIKVTYHRNGKEMTVTAILKNVDGDVAVVKKEESTEVEGAVFTELSGKQKDELNLSGGVQLKDPGDGKWKDAGLEKGFIITHIDKRPVENIGDLKAVLSDRKERYFVEGLYPDGREDYYRIGN